MRALLIFPIELCRRVGYVLDRMCIFMSICFLLSSENVLAACGSEVLVMSGIRQFAYASFRLSAAIRALIGAPTAHVIDAQQNETIEKNKRSALRCAPIYLNGQSKEGEKLLLSPWGTLLGL